MKKNEENEVEILGGAPNPSSKKKKYIKAAVITSVILTVLAALAIAAAMFFCVPAEDSNYMETRQFSRYYRLDESVITQIENVSDSINDVAFSLYCVDNLRARVVFGDVDVSPSVILATSAADYRADNGEIVGDFIYDKKYLAKGARKCGWCYVYQDGHIAIGYGDAEDFQKKALNEGGCFFRQYMLVEDGEISYDSLLKGKALRRAIGFWENKLYLVKSHRKESIFDFSQALADYGFTNALYLPGGEGLWICHTTTGLEYVNALTCHSQYVNRLVFSAK